MSIDRALQEYQQGDADKRIGLFLYSRELRDAFVRIDLDDPTDLSAELSASKH